MLYIKRVFPICVCLWLLFACNSEPTEIAVQDVYLSQDRAEMIVGETVQLEAIIYPSNATDKKIYWASSRQSVAGVSDRGHVTAIEPGVTTVSAFAGGKKADCLITVMPKTIAVSSIVVEPTSLSLLEGEEVKLVAIVKPDEATDKTVYWSSSDDTIASIDTVGKLVALRQGEATIVAKAGDKEARCSVAVGKKVGITSLALNKTSVKLARGETEALEVTIKPDNATNKTVTWISQALSVATVSENGTITAVGKGTTLIIAKAEEMQDTCSVQVIIPVEAIELNQTELQLEEGDDYVFSATIMPNDADDKEITWSSSDPSVAIVDQNGAISALNVGSTQITATVGGKSAYCQVVVNTKVIPVSSVSLNKNTLCLEKGSSERLLAVVEPDNASDRVVVWSSSNGSVASVDQYGTVTALSCGETVVMADAGGKRASCTVTVIVPLPNDISFNTGEVSDITPLSATVTGHYSIPETIVGVPWLAMMVCDINENPGLNSQICMKYAYSGNIEYQLSALNPNTRYYYRSILYYDGCYFYGEIHSFKTAYLVMSGDVDLGLSVKWSACNLGATSTEQLGDYYAWGETEPRAVSTFTVENYAFYDSVENTIILNIGNNISKTKYDAAHVKLAGKWRMPTLSEVTELYDNCKWEDKRCYNKDGYLVTGPNGNFLFIVIAPCSSTASSVWRYSNFWISEMSKYKGWPCYFNYKYFKTNTYMGDYLDPYKGLPIRPVLDF
ncbi:MAG: Ig domain-containing protein [Bacteroidales bacterium]|nr:Ig domain-containing protein [Bacteroidales bacterium]